MYCRQYFYVPFRRLEPSLLFLLVLDMTSYLPTALISEASRFTTTLGALDPCYNFFLQIVQYLDFAFSHYVYFQLPGNLKKTQGIMFDEDSSSLQNILQSLPRREPKIILQRAEYIFPALKDILVSVFVFERIEQKAINQYFEQIIFGNILPLN